MYTYILVILAAHYGMQIEFKSYRDHDARELCEAALKAVQRDNNNVLRAAHCFKKDL